MFEIVTRRQLTEEIVLLEIKAERIAKSALPGQFLIMKLDDYSERIPITVCDYDAEKGTVTVVIQTIGESTKKLNELQVGDSLADFAGPLGCESEFLHEDINELRKKRVLFVAGGLGAAPVYPQVKWFYENDIPCDVIIGARNKDLVILEEEMKKLCENLYVCTDDGSYGFKGNVTVLIKDLVQNQGKHYDHVVAIGPMIMMKFTCLTTKELNIPTIVSMNPIMVDGTGMCGACRLTVGDKVKFACVDGPEFDGHLVNFDEAMTRLNIYKNQGKEALDAITPEPKHNPNCNNHCEDVFDKKKRVGMPEQDPLVRARNFEEVSYGYSLEQAKNEASRCLNCKKPKCVDACPVSINIPNFIQEVKDGNIENAASIISEASSLPAICGRVCPQESQCEGSCIVGIKNEAVAIGRLERFVGDYAITNNVSSTKKAESNGKKIAVVGSGPAGLACAADLAKMGYSVKMFEALHELGGVLVYGIPEFRLPKEKVVANEIKKVLDLGVEIEKNVIVGKTVTIDELIEKEGFEAIFIGSGAGLPKFMNIPGENLNGVFSANEYLTRSNLMKSYLEEYHTPIRIGKKVAVVGGGNVAMDAARTALRLGSEVHVVYRRSEAELPARLEEIHHAKEEGIIFDILTNPIAILGDENGFVSGMKCVKMELGEPDASGRRSPKVVEGSKFIMEVDTVLMSLGTSPNPLISSTTKGIETNKYGCIVVNDDTLATKQENIFAGGDCVTGAATVILAMGAGRTAAKGIDEYLKQQNSK